MELIKEIIEDTKSQNLKFAPLKFHLSVLSDRAAFDQLLRAGKVTFVHDEIHGQLRELVKCKNPSRVLSAEEQDLLVVNHLQGIDENEYGVWFYYPWNQTLVHLLDRDEFIMIRTNRNQHKITQEEQQALSNKTIAIIGLSVGHSIALTIATERICGALRLADFDDLELSNLNRIRSSVKNIGISKVVLAAREIAELDPYLDVAIFPQGITQDNLVDFLTASSKTDILVEVCDGLEMKVQSRIAAKKLGIPVVMDTNDRGMLDIERFDLEQDRPILHGLIDGIDTTNIGLQTAQERMQLIMKIISVETISQKLKESIPQLHKTINALPQLASSVVLGGAVATDICRRILLKEFNNSGRYFVDLDQIICDHK